MRAKEKRILKRLVEKIKKIVPEAEIILFGSKARGDDTLFSDVDILILVDKKEKKEEILEVCFQFELEHDILISPLIRTRDEWNSFPYNVSEIRHFIEEEGVRL